MSCLVGFKMREFNLILLPTFCFSIWKRKEKEWEGKEDEERREMK